MNIEEYKDFLNKLLDTAEVEGDLKIAVDAYTKTYCLITNRDYVEFMKKVFYNARMGM